MLTRTHEVQGIEVDADLLISSGWPSTISEEDFNDSAPLPDLLPRLKPGEHLYLVDYAGDPSHTRLTRLV